MSPRTQTHTRLDSVDILQDTLNHNRLNHCKTVQQTFIWIIQTIHVFVYSSTATSVDFKQ